jgi:alpha,alpha-trehalase
MSTDEVDRRRWQELDAEISRWWDSEISHATEDDVRADASGQLLFLPFPYIGPTSPGRVFGHMYAWDTDFINRALIAHGRLDLTRNHILNYLSMIDRYGFMPNANIAVLRTRSQTPLIADSVWRYHRASADRDLLHEAYPRLVRNYREYWNASHHQTPIGLATNRDLGDPNLVPELAAEAEVGLDWTPIYGEDVRRCVPLVTNCALVRYGRILSLIAEELGESEAARKLASDAERRARLVRKYCWNDEIGFFLEYDYVAERQLPFISNSAYWTLWSGVATRAQARRLVANLHWIEQPFGLATTDVDYPLPHPPSDYGETWSVTADGATIVDSEIAIVGGRGQLQWMYPAGWAPMHVVTVEGLDAYGFRDDAERVARKVLTLLLDQYRETGHLWEKYNVVDGTVVMPNARCGNIWMQGWTAAAVVLLGRRLFEGASLEER